MKFRGDLGHVTKDGRPYGKPQGWGGLGSDEGPCRLPTLDPIKSFNSGVAGIAMSLPTERAPPNGVRLLSIW